MTDWRMLKDMNLLYYFIAIEEYFSGLSPMFKVEEEVLMCSLLRCNTRDNGSYLNNRNQKDLH